MDRRGFLRALGLGVAAAVAPTKTYAFFGGILRRKPVLAPPLELICVPIASAEQYVPGKEIYVQDWRYMVRIANIDVSTLVAEPGHNERLIALMDKWNRELRTRNT